MYTEIHMYTLYSVSKYACVCVYVYIYIYVYNYTAIGDRALNRHIMRYAKYCLLSDKAVQISLQAPVKGET